MLQYRHEGSPRLRNIHDGRPRVLLIDEVLSVGDKEFQDKSRKMILERINSSKTSVIVSHDEKRLRQVCTKIYRITNGKIIELLFSENVDSKVNTAFEKTQ